MNRLGESLKNGPMLSAEAISLNVDLLGELARDFRRAGAEDFALCGTSALRRARTAMNLFRAANDDPRHVCGDHRRSRRGGLTYMGAISGRDVFPDERVAVMDLGGGSTEIIEGRGYVPGQGYSIDVGSVMLTNEFFA